MSSAGELSRLSAVALAADIRAGNVSSSEVVAACLERIEDREPTVRAWAHLDRHRAMAAARARDREPADGPLHGVPVGVKDICDTVDLPTACGTPALAGRRPAQDAACVARLRAAGAVVIGKTVTTELALFTPGPTRNPHDPAHTPGGSSSGSAAAVADGMVPLAIGTQTAGSVVRPASFCGVFGHKPTAGVVPTAGVLPVSPTLDTVGAFARHVDDLRVAADVLAGRQGAAPGQRLPARPRVGVVRTPDWHMLDPDARDRIDAALDRLAEHARVDELILPDGFAGLVDAQQVIMGVEAARCLGPLRSDHEAQLSPGLLAELDSGVRRAWAYEAALAHADETRPAVDDALAGVDVVVTPSVRGEAPRDLTTTGDPLLCRAWTLLGTPAVSVPGLAGPRGMPLGIQIVAARGADEAALAGAAWLAEVL